MPTGLSLELHFDEGSGTITKDLGSTYLDRVTEIAFALGVPISKIKQNDANLASSFISDRAWYRDNLAHICRFDEGILNEELLPKFELETECFLAYKNVIPKDEQLQEKRLLALNAAGIVNYEYVRMQLGIEEKWAPDLDPNLKSKISVPTSSSETIRVTPTTSVAEKHDEVTGSDGEDGTRKPKGSGSKYA